MDPELLPSLVNYYQASQCTKELAYKLDIKKQSRINHKLQEKLEKSQAIQQDLREQIEELKLALSKEHATSEVRQREIESLRSRNQGSDKADKALADSLKIQADSYKREIREVREDLKMRDEELQDLRDDAKERENDLKEARELTRTRDKEIKEVRDQLRARESEVRKANHAMEKIKANAQRLEMEAQEAQDALEATKEALVETERRAVKPRATTPKAKPKPKPKSPVLADEPSLPEALTDYTAPPAKLVKKKPSTANKENITAKPRKRKVQVDDFSASPPRSSPPAESPKRRKVTKSDFSMTPFIDKTKKLDVVPLSPPSSKSADIQVPVQDKPKKKRKLLGGMKTLMDDTPKKVISKKSNLGKDLSPLKRPKSSAGLIIEP